MTPGSDRPGTAEGDPARRCRVALVAAPFGSLERPPLGLGLLQAAARRHGHECTVHHLTFAFADHIGAADYQWMCHDVPYTAFAGEWVFAAAAHGTDLGTDAYVAEVLRGTWLLDDEAIARVRRVRDAVPGFVDRCIRDVPWGDHDVVGFTSTFQQNLASLALARAIKDAHPHVTTVLGGANWEGPMGAAQHRRLPFVDVACRGEADLSFPALLDALATGAGPATLATIPGVIARTDDGTPVEGPPAESVQDLDALPVPDVGDWVEARSVSTAAAATRPLLVMETSRGCWWGAHSHCTFCGLNGAGIGYRSKSADRALDELDLLVAATGAHRVAMVDNIMDMRYLRTFLPRLAERGDDLEVFYEVKANLTSAQIAQLRVGGVTEVQPGIESLSDHVLDLMRKGTTGLRNIAMLKWCAEHGVIPDWNLLYGFPGETADDYREIAEAVAAIGHLTPPTACGPIRLDRFSPYHDDPAAHGMTAVTAMAPYRHLHPWPADVLDEVAYYFDFDYADGRGADDHVRTVRAAVDAWQASGPTGQLLQTVSDPDRVVLVDTRDGAVVRHEMLGWEAAAYLACDRPRPAEDLLRLPELAGVGPRALAGLVNRCVADRTMLVRRRTCLALAVRHPARRPDAPLRLSRRIPVLSASGPTPAAPPSAVPVAVHDVAPVAVRGVAPVAAAGES